MHPPHLSTSHPLTSLSSPLSSSSSSLNNITSTTIPYDHELKRTWRPWLIVLSYLVSFLGAYTTTQLYAQSRLSRRSTRSRTNTSTLLWLFLSSIAFGGCALWSFHFVAMLALNIGVPMHFNFYLTAFGAIFAVGGSMFGLGSNVLMKHRSEFGGLGFGGIYSGSGASGSGWDVDEGYETGSSGYVPVSSSSDEENVRSSGEEQQHRAGDGTEAAAQLRRRQTEMEEYNMVANLWRQRRRRRGGNGRRSSKSSLTVLTSLAAFLRTRTAILFNARIHVVGGSMGLTVAGMHYIGMRAMSFDGYTVWNPFLVILSVLVAHVVCMVAVAYMPDDGDGLQQLLFAIVASGGINAMHWIGMAAATFRTHHPPPHTHDGFPTALPLTVAFVALFTCLLSYAALARNALRARDALVEMIVTKRRLWKAVAEKEAADRSNKVKTDFINVASHELRTPLHAITGFTDLLELTDMDEEQRDFVAAIKASCHTLDLISRNVLDFARLEDEGCENVAVPSCVDIGRLCRDTLRTCASSSVLTNSEVDLVFVLGEGVKMAMVDETYFARVVMNLVGNALKFTREGYVMCSVSRQGNSLHVTVSDTGIGVSAASQKVIFEPFQQADSSLTRQHLGTGLGLTICRQLVGKMGGRISLKSEEGLGSEFTVVLPGAIPESAVDDEGEGGAVVRKIRERGKKLKVALWLSRLTGEKIAVFLSKYFDVILIDPSSYHPSSSSTSTPSAISSNGSATLLQPLLPNNNNNNNSNNASSPRVSPRSSKPPSPTFQKSTSWQKALQSADRVIIDFSYLYPEVTQFIQENTRNDRIWFCFGERVDIQGSGVEMVHLQKRPVCVDEMFVEIVYSGRKSRGVVGRLGSVDVEVLGEPLVATENTEVSPSPPKFAPGLSTNNSNGSGSVGSGQQSNGSAPGMERKSSVQASDIRLPTSNYNGTVLLVEDNPVNQRLGAKMLEKLGVPYDVAENGLVAVDKIIAANSISSTTSDSSGGSSSSSGRRRYALVLMDTQMPVLDGLEATRRIRELEKEGKVKGRTNIISLTANVSTESRKECEAAGADSFLPKPLTLARLRGEVERVFSNDSEGGG